MIRDTYAFLKQVAAATVAATHDFTVKIDPLMRAVVVEGKRAFTTGDIVIQHAVSFRECADATINPVVFAIRDIDRRLEKE